MFVHWILSSGRFFCYNFMENMNTKIMKLFEKKNEWLNRIQVRKTSQKKYSNGFGIFLKVLGIIRLYRDYK
jgi:hypothetical protein